MILVIDNYDSFTFNLVQALGALGAEVRVFRNDAIDAAGVSGLRPLAVVLSPGPGRPENAGCCLDVVRSCEAPVLGVCLGHQAIALAHGGRIELAPEPVHGRTAPVEHDGLGLYRGLPAPFVVARYHSLVVSSTGLPECLQVQARTADLIMGLGHRQRPQWGVQFHPESIATPAGPALLANFLELARRAGPKVPPC